MNVNWLEGAKTQKKVKLMKVDRIFHLHVKKAHFWADKLIMRAIV